MSRENAGDHRVLADTRLVARPVMFYTSRNSGGLF